MILFGEALLRRVLLQSVEPYRVERPDQGKGDANLLAEDDANTARAVPVRYRERLGGLLRVDCRDAG
jgi:hypothetical protein